MRRLILVRHGQSVWNVTDRLTSRTDIPLTASGEEQARSLGRALAGLPIDRAVTSPLSRARRTAELILEPQRGHPPLQVDDRLVEVDCGPFEGLTETELYSPAHRAATIAWRSGQACPPGAESDAAAIARAAEVFGDLGALDGTTLVTSHGHFLRVFLATQVLGLAGDGASVRRVSLENGRITIVEEGSTGWVLRLLNASSL